MAGRPLSRLGWRRIDWVRITLGDPAGAYAEVQGVRHRLPATELVPLGTAARLISEGVPVVISREPQDIGNGTA